MSEREEIIDLEEFINQQDEIEQLAREKFPFDTSKCSLYIPGIQRQILFACLTCAPSNVLCYSCGISCHPNHNVIELDTKRGFQCDCGTTRLNNTCTLRHHQRVHGEFKEAWRNQGIKYSKNFLGKYCFCNESVNDLSYGRGAMYQCILGTQCQEDWFHARCILNLTFEEELQRKQKNSEFENHDDEDFDDDDDVETVFPEIPKDFGGLVCKQCLGDAPELINSGAVLSIVNGYVFLKEDYGRYLQNSDIVSKFPFLNGDEQTYTPEKESESTLNELFNILRSKQPHDKVIDNFDTILKMHNQLKEYLESVLRQKSIVTKEDIEAFFEYVKCNDLI